MTTAIDAAAPRRARVSFFSIGAFVSCAVLLSGCASTSSLLSGGPGDTPPATETAALPAGAPVAPAKGKVAIAPVIGAPQTAAKQLQAQLATNLEKRSIGVSKCSTDATDFTLRGYIVAAKEKNSVKLSYIWNVDDAAGKRVNQITGEEVVAGVQGKDPWTALTPEMSQTVADKTATQLATWLPSQPTGAVQSATAKPAAKSGPVRVMVTDIKGATGDGQKTLKTAMERELGKGGMPVAASAGDNVYGIQAAVAIGKVQDGQQPIEIKWSVKDPCGNHLGEITQSNKIPQGSLDGAWGETANAIAEAASKGVAKFVPQKPQA